MLYNNAPMILLVKNTVFLAILLYYSIVHFEFASLEVAWPPLRTLLIRKRIGTQLHFLHTS